MANIKACIFDLDGVIVDTAKYHYLAWKEIAEELGFCFTKEDNENLKGVSRMDSLNILLKIGGISLDEARKLELAQKKNKYYLNYISKMNGNELLPGVLNFIKQIREKGLKIALGSVSKNSMTILNNLKIASYFDIIIDGNKITHAKPNPEVFLKGSEELDLLPSACVVFEDSKAGILAAKNAGMYSIGIGSKSILEEADIVIQSFNDMTYERLLEIRSKG